MQKTYDGLIIGQTGAWDIYEERLRQVTEEGFSSKHDDQWDAEELVQAAKVYIDENYPFYDAPMWPYRWDRKWHKPSKDPIRNLIKAGALIAAEIDRLRRLNDKRSTDS